MRPDEHEKEEGYRVEHEAPGRSIRPELAEQDAQEALEEEYPSEGGDDRPRHAAQAPEHHDDEGVEARDEVEARGGEEAHIVGVDSSADARDEAADDEGKELVARNVYAHRARGYLVLPHRESRPSGAGPHEVADDDEDEDEEDESPGPVRELGDAEHPSPAFHFLEGKYRVRVDEESLHDDGEAQGRDPEIVGAQAEHGQAEEKAHFRGEGAREDYGEEEGGLQRDGGGQDSGRVGRPEQGNEERRDQAAEPYGATTPTATRAKR